MSDISFNLPKGSFLSILGPNGSGKSTLLKLIAGLYKPDKGKVILNDREISLFIKKELASVLSYVPQTIYSVFPYSVFEIVMMGRNPHLNMFGVEKKKDVEIVEEYLELLEISELKSKGINEISGGEAQRAFIARALAQEPELIILDEPNAHLDIKHQILIFEILSELIEKKNISVISVSHNLNLIAQFSDRIIALKKGRLILDGDREAIFSSANINDIFDVKSVVKKDAEDGSLSIIIKK
ncbi:MAG: ABC transporter ATP-binding protein [Chlorobi bacterium]|nr:ABC transporter ATP-binding protein [Chlorobiota bacterium]